MANRPVFIPEFNGTKLVNERCFAFTWASGFSATQKKKNVVALHAEAKRHGIKSILEISTKSNDRLGLRLSALSLKTEIGSTRYSLESVYQGCKVFEQGGPFVNVFDMSPRDAKRYINDLDCGTLVEFQLRDRSYPLKPENAFYDWLYIRSLIEHADWIRDNVQYDAYTDIEFNPAKQFNCQARAFAEFLSLQRRGMLEEAAEDFDSFVKILIAAQPMPNLTDDLLSTIPQ